MSPNNIIYGGFGAIFLTLGFVTMLVHRAPSNVATMELAQGSSIFKVSDHKYNFQYQLSPRTKTLRGVVAVADPQNGIKSGGALKTLHYFSNADASKFKRIYGGASVCPAPFFNRYAKQKILFASDPAIIRKLTQWKLQAYKNVPGWENFDLRGRCISKFVSGYKGEREVRLPSNMFENCLSFHVESLSHRPANLAAQRS